MLIYHQLAHILRSKKPLLVHPNLVQNIIRGFKDIPKYAEKRIITQAEVDEFARLTGDTNYIHSSECPLERRCVHGAFLNAIVAGMIGTKLPGAGSIVLQQEFTFPQKCVCDEEISITLRLLENRHIKKIGYECRQNGLPVFIGTANIIVKNVEQK